MNLFRMKISTPDGNRYDDEAFMLSLRGIEGDLAILAGHVPFITSVKPGECKLELADGSVRVGRCDGGILSVSKEAVTLLAGSFQWNE